MRGHQQATTRGSDGEQQEHRGDQRRGAKGPARRRPRWLSLRAGAALSLAAGTLLLPGQVSWAAASARVYVVQPGDTLWNIALSFGTTVNALTAANGLGNPNHLAVGQTLFVAGALTPGQGAAGVAGGSGGSTAYVVQLGDTLSTIAQRLGIPPATLAAANGITDVNRLSVGQVLSVGPIGAMAPSSAAPAVTPAVGAPAAGTATLYVVRQGDTLSAIAVRLGVAPGGLATANSLADPSRLRVGQVLTIEATAPDTGTTSTLPVVAAAGGGGSAPSGYLVQPGDTLSAIAQHLGMTPAALALANGIADARLLRAGQMLQLPAAGAGPLNSAPQAEVMVDKATVQSLLESAAAAAGVDSALVKAVAWQESGWQMVTAADGGVGVMQLMPYTTDWLNQSVLTPPPIDPFVPADNVRAGVALLRYQLDAFAGDVSLAVAAYHQGQSSVQAHGLFPETQRYVANVLALRQRFAQ